MSRRVDQFPAGAAVTAERLDSHLHETLAVLRSREPVAWVPALDAWFVSSRALAVEVMRDAATFTVDDPRFSTAQVLGPSMLSLDGPEHGRHRDPFGDAFRLPDVRRRVTDAVTNLAREIVTDLQPNGGAELRRELAGPLAARVMALALDLVDVDATTLLAWYREIVGAVSAIASGGATTDRPEAVDALAAAVARTIDAGQGVLADAREALTVDEIVSNTGVLLFGGIETTEGMTANLFAHLLAEPGQWDAVAADRSLIPNAIEESLRLEPSVVRIDRFATRDTRLGEADIERGDFVIIMISAANRDPAAFANPDRFDIRRANAKQHLTFAHGPHACLGMHLARVEAAAAVESALDLLPGLRLDPNASPPAMAGTVFRKPDRVDVVWSLK
ncbi:MAG TPA: cytochrome P450 [Ilumatobacter sp.]